MGTERRTMHGRHVQTEKIQYRKFETNIPRKGIARRQSQFLCLWAIYIYSHDWSAYSAAGKYVDRSWEYINRSQAHECGKGTEAAQRLFWEYINGIFVAVQLPKYIHILPRIDTLPTLIFVHRIRFPSGQSRNSCHPPPPPPPHPTCQFSSVQDCIMYTSFFPSFVFL